MSDFGSKLELAFLFVFIAGTSAYGIVSAFLDVLDLASGRI